MGADQKVGYVSGIGQSLKLTLQAEITTTYSEDPIQGEPDQRDRWKITMRPAEMGRGVGDDHVIDLDSIIEFCKGNKLTEAAKEKMVRLLRCWPT